MSLVRVHPDNAWRMDLYMPFVIIYFFFNSLFLPIGLLYTTALAPLFYYWLWRQERKWIVTRFLAIMAPFALFQWRNEVDVKAYAVSLAVGTAIFITGYTFYVFINWTQRLDDIMHRVVLINFAMALVGLALFFTERCADASLSRGERTGRTKARPDLRDACIGRAPGVAQSCRDCEDSDEAARIHGTG